ncbi:autotransporter domain-containing protein [Fusobacterium hominis]|uniref:autotransporter domain-containing protein n=1 Tax=Fusobacterium hominis TaxID=2764326 RepID=UPI0022E89F7B|nr:autotransporter domain-containing protein [Fusobacterium hominis]
MHIKANHKKILLYCLAILAFTNCGGSGGGGASSLPIEPNNTGIISNKNPIQGINPSPQIKNPEKKEKDSMQPEDDNKKNNSQINADNPKVPVIEEPIRATIVKPTFTNRPIFDDYDTDKIPSDNKNINGHDQIVTIMDSDFLTHKQELEKKYENIDILKKYSSNPAPNQSLHGERVLDIMTENTKFKIVAASIGEKLGDKIFVAPSLELYKDIFKKFGDQKVKVINQSWGVDNNKDIKEFDKYKSFLLPTQLVGGEIKEIVEPYDAAEKRGEELLKFYSKSVDDGGLFVWANGNHANDGSLLYNPSIQAQLPVRNPSLEKGWISVIGVKEKDSISLVDPNSNYYAYKHYPNRLAYPGLAARWAISASGDGLASANGTLGSSYAAPRVARAATLVASKFPWMTNSQVRETLFTTTDEPELVYDHNGNLLDHNGNIDETKNTRYRLNTPSSRYGWGILNTPRALKGPGAFLEDLLKVDYNNYTDHILYFQARIPENQESYFENDIKGDRALRKSGKGRLHLTGTNTFGMTTQIDEGTLDIYKQHAANINVNKNGTLILHNNAFIGSISIFDDHTIVGADVTNNGVVKLDGKKATIAGNYNVEENGITEIDFNSTLEVLGKATLSTSTLKVSSKDYLQANPIKKEVIHGNIDEVKVEDIKVDGMRKAIAHKENNGLIIEMSRENAAAYLENPSISSEYTATNVEKVLLDIDNKVQNNNASLEDMKRGLALIEMSKEEFKNSTYKMSGEIYASAQALTFAQAQNINRNISNHLSSLNDFKTSNYEWQGWMSGLYSKGHLKEAGYATGKTDMQGELFGIDKKINNSTQIGIAFAHANSKAEFNRYAGQSKSESFGTSIYAKKYLKNDAYILGKLGVSKFDTKVQRDLVDINGTNTTGNIKHKDKMLSSYVEIGKHFSNFTPFIGYSQDYLKRGAFNESNAAWGINTNSKNYSNSNVFLGIRGEYTVNSYNFNSYITHSINVGNRSLNFDGKFNGTDINQHFKGINQVKNITWFGVGLTKEITPQLDIIGNIDFRFEENHKADSILSAGLQYKF